MNGINERKRIFSTLAVSKSNTEKCLSMARIKECSKQLETGSTARSLSVMEIKD